MKVVIRGGPTRKTVTHYRAQVSTYLEATGASIGLIVLVTTGDVIEVKHRAAYREPTM
jgi:hypothetical protein